MNQQSIFSTKSTALIVALIIFTSFYSIFPESQKEKIGVLLVNHGSRSETWRKSLLQLEKNVTGQILQSKKIEAIKTAFMEYNEPSIATRLKEFDQNHFTSVILIPIFLTVSPHSFEDIPTIIGQKEDPKSMEMLRIEKIERYTPKAKIKIAPLLDFTDVLKKNVLRRVEALSKNPKNEGIVLIGYGDETYDKEWGKLFNEVALFVNSKLGIANHSYGWCGHIAHYNPNETTNAIRKVLDTKQTAIVIPVLVAMDEMFQIKIIGTGVKNAEKQGAKIIYKPDSILPDKNIEEWVVHISNDYANKIAKVNAN